MEHIGLSGPRCQPLAASEPAAAGLRFAACSRLSMRGYGSAIAARNLSAGDVDEELDWWGALAVAGSDFGYGWM